LTPHAWPTSREDDSAHRRVPQTIITIGGHQSATQHGASPQRIKHPLTSHKAPMLAE
jgi:hypothetical protein